MKKVNRDRESIYDKLHSLGYKVTFWYEKGRLDAVCIGKWEGEDLVLGKEYTLEEIADILFTDFLSPNQK